MADVIKEPPGSHEPTEFVKEPKNFGIPGKKVAMSDPISKGTIIMPPGTRSIERLMGSWAIRVSCLTSESEFNARIDHVFD